MTARLALLFMMAIPMTALAQGRTVLARDGEVVRVSATEPNLVEAATGKVSAFVFTAGAFVETVDHEAGVVYFRPLNESPSSGFVEVMGDDGVRARYSLVLVPDDSWPAQRIVMGTATPEAGPDDLAPQAPLPDGHVARVKEVIRRLAAAEGNTLDEGWALRGGLRIAPLARVRVAGLVGELLRLDNPGDHGVLVDEAILRSGANTVAVAAPMSRLEPGSSVRAYRVLAENEGGQL